MNVLKVERTADLHSAGQQDGDMCYVTDTQHYWIWDSKIWRDLGTKQDLDVLNLPPNDRLGLKWVAAFLKWRETEHLEEETT